MKGKIFEHEWTNGKYKGVAYRVEFLSDKKLRWTGLKGFPKGKTDIEEYTLKKNKDTINFSWLAQDGLLVNIIYDFSNNTAKATLNKNGEETLLEGIFKIIDQ